MDYQKKLKSQVVSWISVATLLIAIVSFLLWYLLFEVFEVYTFPVLVIAFVVSATTAAIVAEIVAKKVLAPLDALTQAIIHVSPSHEYAESSPPNTESLKIGRELITSLTQEVYQLASLAQKHQPNVAAQRNKIIQAINVLNNLPMPILVLNNQQIITNISAAATEYLESESTEILGKTVQDSIQLEFSGETTLNDWIVECQEKAVTTSSSWERVRVTTKEGLTKQCDVMARYNRDNPSGADYVIALLDRTDRYQQDDDSLGFVAMAVHELRTPLTMLRGYIEVLEDEVAGQLNDELKTFMKKMEVAAGQLTIFVNNILNVAKIEQNQLMMQLEEVEWSKALDEIVADLQIRAEIKGMTVEKHIPENLPTAAIDRTSIYEVLGNLVDNAIKYSKNKGKIIISTTIGKDGNIETTVQDFGVGMPTNVTTNLFEKFYRNHRTSGKIGGTGLGLYLTKAIISAHGGSVWVHSKEGEGSTFGFSIVPYANLADELKNSDNRGITRQSHGWVKNHSFYKR